MSTTTKQENPWVNRVLSAIFVIGMSISSYFLSETMNQIKDIDSRVNKIEIYNATISGNKFTYSDWQQSKALLDQDRQALEKRTIVLEQNFLSVKELLTEIRLDIKELKQDNHYGQNQ